MGAPRTKKLEILKDRTCKLSDDILCYILSLLPFREAAGTSILSQRWRYLWKSHIKISRSLSLDFLAMNGCSDSSQLSSVYVDSEYWKKSTLQMERIRFLKWAEEILQLGHNCGIDSFRVRFYMKRNRSHLVDSWINVAISAKVQNIDIDLSHFAGCVESPPEAMLYTFPCWLFTQKTGSLVKRLHLSSCVLGCLDCYLFSSLVDLHLKEVPITQENIAKLLSNCPNLVNLSLVNCEKLRRLEILGQCHKLKCLIVSMCTVEMITIDALNLTRFDYRGNPINFSLQNTPRLSDVRMHIPGKKLSASALEKLSRDATKMESFLLLVNLCQGKKIPIRLPFFVNLKKLVLMVSFPEGVLWGLTPLIQACPCLQKLEFHLFKSARESESVERPFDSLQLHLKEVMLTGFLGTRHEMEFIESLVRHSPVLEKVTIDYEYRIYDHDRGVHIPDSNCKWRYFTKQQRENSEARETSEKKNMEEQAPALFAKILPPGVQLNIL